MANVTVRHYITL